MSRGPVRDRARSLRARLLERAREREEDFQLVLTWYGIERLLYRLSQSPHAERFTLKGAMLFSVWRSEEAHRPTRDLDLLGAGDARIPHLEEIFRELCGIACDDGIELDPSSVRGEEIRAPHEYPGVRVKLVGHLAGARIHLQVDIGFGDAVVPPPDAPPGDAAAGPYGELSRRRGQADPVARVSGQGRRRRDGVFGERRRARRVLRPSAGLGGSEWNPLRG